MFYIYGITEKGVMPHNEDAMLICNAVASGGKLSEECEKSFIVAVCDGVSGETSGEMASVLCLNTVSLIDDFSTENLSENLYKAHIRLTEISEGNPQHSNMQTTLCGVAVDENGSVTSFNVGDSRLYVCSRESLRQVSRDQSLVQILYEEGNITFEEKKTHPRKNIICPVFGNMKSKPEIDIKSVRIHNGDIILMCTDGLSDYVENIDMWHVLELPESLERRTELLVEKALENGGKDNITVITMMYCEDNEENPCE